MDLSRGILLADSMAVLMVKQRVVVREAMMVASTVVS
jgi:hypothetical protein